MYAVRRSFAPFRCATIERMVPYTGPLRPGTVVQPEAPENIGVGIGVAAVQRVPVVQVIIVASASQALRDHSMIFLPQYIR